MAPTTRRTTRSMTAAARSTINHPTANANVNTSRQRRVRVPVGRLEQLLEQIGGVITPAINDPPVCTGGKARCETHQWECPICKKAFTRERSLKDHFVGCARRNGNPYGFAYSDGEGFDTAEDVRSGGVITRRT
ncbi:hypothetical protein P7C71_g5300, partial [Lecanoromycetidae sp. Uapishka_2]